jgi:tRNA1Val (adenine37-N6)-methyltransferase
MKVGTDAVLLGAWTDITDAKRILEVGTGSGVIALMLAQRTNEHVLIDALEIDQHSFEQAAENISQSPWEKRVNVHPKEFQKWKTDFKYDLIVSNPPFFSRSLLPPDLIRTQARHSVKLTPSDLLLHSKTLLSSQGKLCVVLPFSEGNKFIRSAIANQFYLTSQTAVFTRKEKPQERWLLEFRLTETTPIQSVLTLFSDGNIRSSAYNELTSDFYLTN